jgi:uncharacterized membrane protein YeiH
LPAEDGPDGGAGEAMEVGQLDSVVHWLGVLGVAVFAASGALEASRRQMDVVGFALVATVTGVGGGTLRDLLLGLSPVFWVEAPGYVLLCAAVAVLVFFTAHLVESRFKVLLWADALGLALFCATGAERALAAGASGVVAVMMGVMTATVGGVVRDVLCAQVPLILRRELYATAAAAAGDDGGGVPRGVRDPGAGAGQRVVVPGLQGAAGAELRRARVRGRQVTSTALQARGR